MEFAIGTAECAAGADRGELLIITDQSDTRPTTDCKLDDGIEGQGVGHARLVDDHQSRRADHCRPIRQVAVIQ